MYNGLVEIIYWLDWLATHFSLYRQILAYAYGGDARVASVMAPTQARQLLVIIMQSIVHLWMKAGRQYPFAQETNMAISYKLRSFIVQIFSNILELFGDLICKMPDRKAFAQLFTAVFEKDESFKKAGAEGTIVTVRPEALFVEFDKSVGDFDTVYTLWLLRHLVERDLHVWLKADIRYLCEYWDLFTKSLRDFDIQMPLAQYSEISQALNDFKARIEQDQQTTVKGIAKA